MNRLQKYFIASVITISSIVVGFVIGKTVFTIIQFFFIDYNIKPYLNNLSGKDSAFIKTCNYFLTLVPSDSKYTHDFAYQKNSRRKRTFILNAHSTDSESIFLKNISYNSKEAREFLQYVGIKKTQLDTLDSYMDLINCKSIRHYGIFKGKIGKPKVQLKMNPKDLYSYDYFDSISFTNRYRWDTIIHQHIIDSVIVRKGPHILMHPW